METHTEIIKCPDCGAIQNAEVRHTIPWYDYTHICEKCENMIMESEWEHVEREEVKC